MCCAKPYCGNTVSRAAISASRVTFASIDAALISATRLSPFTTASDGTGNAGQRLPSISTYSGAICRPATARCMASIVACKIFNSSISCGSARPRLQLNAFSLISSNSARRRFSDSFFESLRPIIGRAGSRMTAAVTTAPTKGPRPTSSTPATKCVCGYTNSIIALTPGPHPPPAHQRCNGSADAVHGMCRALHGWFCHSPATATALATAPAVRTLPATAL